MVFELYASFWPDALFKFKIILLGKFFFLGKKKTEYTFKTVLGRTSITLSHETANDNLKFYPIKLVFKWLQQ